MSTQPDTATQTKNILNILMNGAQAKFQPPVSSHMCTDNSRYKNIPYLCSRHSRDPFPAINSWQALKRQIVHCYKQYSLLSLKLFPSM